MLTKIDAGYPNYHRGSCAESNFSSKKNSTELPTRNNSIKERHDEEKRVQSGREEAQHDRNEEQNCAVDVTKTQQWKILIATSLTTFWVLGKYTGLGGLSQRFTCLR